MEKEVQLTEIRNHELRREDMFAKSQNEIASFSKKYATLEQERNTLETKLKLQIEDYQDLQARYKASEATVRKNHDELTGLCNNLFTTTL